MFGVVVTGCGVVVGIGIACGVVVIVVAIVDGVAVVARIDVHDDVIVGGCLCWYSYC